jgi:hypothetical protein
MDMLSLLDKLSVENWPYLILVALILILLKSKITIVYPRDDRDK